MLNKYHKSKYLDIGDESETFVVLIRKKKNSKITENFDIWPKNRLNLIYNLFCDLAVVVHCAFSIVIILFLSPLFDNNLKRNIFLSYDNNTSYILHFSILQYYSLRVQCSVFIFI